MHDAVATLLGMPIKLIDFMAKWCGPCRVMEPVLASLEQEYAGRVAIEEVDVEEDRQRAEQFAVRTMPTFVIVRDGQEVGRVVGTRPRAFLAGMLDRALAGDVAITSP